MNELIIFEEINPVVIYKEGGMEPLLRKIKERALSFVPDVSTAKGRKEIASIAHQIARSKTYLDNLGKQVKEEAQRVVKQVDAERKKMRDELDALKEEVRRPLTEYEEKEKERIRKLEARVEEIKHLATIQDEYGRTYGLEVLEENLKKLKAIRIDESFEEYASMAAIEKDKGLTILEETIKEVKRIEAERAELERLRKEQEERERKEREKRIAEEAARRAKEEAERKAKEALERAEREKQEAIRREKEKAERERQELLRKQEEERLTRLRKEEEKRRREDDKKHRAKIENNIINALESIGVKEGRKIIDAINAGEIPHVQIIY